jgi:hypothetical protein
MFIRKSNIYFTAGPGIPEMWVGRKRQKNLEPLYQWKP